MHSRRHPRGPFDGLDLASDTFDPFEQLFFRRFGVRHTIPLPYSGRHHAPYMRQSQVTGKVISSNVLDHARRTFLKGQRKPAPVISSISKTIEAVYSTLARVTIS